MTVTAAPPAEDGTRVVRVTCDAGRAAGCLRERRYETTLLETGSGVRWALGQAAARGWWLRKREGGWQTTCPVCAEGSPDESSRGTVPAPRDAFVTPVQSRVREALAKTPADRDQAQRQGGALRTRLAQTARAVENHFASAAAAVRGRQLTTETKGSAEAPIHRLTWGGGGPARTLEVAISLPERRLAYRWSTRAGGTRRYDVDPERLGEFDLETLVLQLIDPELWLAGAFPDPLPGASSR
jgi:hypothetical protein